jgi:hypothetical protein
VSNEIITLSPADNFLVEFEVISRNLPEETVKKLTNNFSKKVRSPLVSRTQGFLSRCSVCPESLLNCPKTAAYYKQFRRSIISEPRLPRRPSQIRKRTTNFSYTKLIMGPDVSDHSLEQNFYSPSPSNTSVLSKQAHNIL